MKVRSFVCSLHIGIPVTEVAVCETTRAHAHVSARVNLIVTLKAIEAIWKIDSAASRRHEADKLYDRFADLTIKDCKISQDHTLHIFLMLQSGYNIMSTGMCPQCTLIHIKGHS